MTKILKDDVTANWSAGVTERPKANTNKVLSMLTTEQLVAVLADSGYTDCGITFSQFQKWTTKGDACYRIHFRGENGRDSGYVYVSCEVLEIRADF